MSLEWWQCSRCRFDGFFFALFHSLFNQSFVSILCVREREKNREKDLEEVRKTKSVTWRAMFAGLLVFCLNLWFFATTLSRRRASQKLRQSPLSLRWKCPRRSRLFSCPSPRKKSQLPRSPHPRPHPDWQLWATARQDPALLLRLIIAKSKNL